MELAPDQHGVNPVSVLYMFLPLGAMTKGSSGNDDTRISRAESGDQGLAISHG
tara:strand:- start:1922 stop:2080 length:159 start_codon:yes stop_codon:yes gene_type:complete